MMDLSLKTDNMKKILAAALMLLSLAAGAQTVTAPAPSDLAQGVYAGGYKSHVQGIAVDREKGYMYMSFTTVFLKTDLQGNVLASMSGIPGHLGAMTLNPEDGKVYASLEFKDDEIGRGIARTLGIAQPKSGESVFYVAVIDVDRMDRPDMDAQKDGVFKTVCIRDAVRDYADIVTNQGTEMPHRYGCSGIDGVTFAPAFGSRSGRMYLYVAYGIYSDNKRTDNDYQVLLCYDVRSWDRRYAREVVYDAVHQSGPEKPLRKYFVRTMNTSWGVQNMGYDPFTGRMYMMVYRGRKSGCPNFSTYAVDMASKPFKAVLQGNDDTLHKEGRVWQLPLSQVGMHDEATDTWGWNFKYGSTGFCPLGDGWYLFSENGLSKDDPSVLNYTNIRLYHWSDDPLQPFVKY